MGTVTLQFLSGCYLLFNAPVFGVSCPIMASVVSPLTPPPKFTGLCSEPPGPPDVTAFKDGAFQEVTKVKWVAQVYPDPTWLVYLSEEAIRTQAHAVWGRRENEATCKPGREAQNSEHRWHLDLSLQPSELWENKFLLLKSLSLRHSMAALANQYPPPSPFSPQLCGLLCGFAKHADF